MYKYKVIWFDDEHESLDIIREKAFLNDIQLVGFGSAKQGIDELERNIKSYDAAIIDGLFFLNSEQSGTPLTDTAISEVAKALSRLEMIKKLPWFILSGQTSFTKEKNRIADVFKNNEVYDKVDDSHLTKLWIEIKTEAEKQVETQIRLKYRSVLDICSSHYLGEEAEKPLMFLLESVEKYNEKSNTEDKLNAVRKLMEKSFSMLNRIQVLPDIVWKGPGNISGASKFLSCTHSAFEYNETIFSPSIVFLVKNILHVTQDGSHAEGDLNLQVDSFIKNQSTGYLFNSVVFQLMEVMIWLKAFVDTHRDYEKNGSIASLKPTETSQVIEGVIQQDKNRNYYCENLIITYKHFNDNRYAVGDKIRILKIGQNSNEKTMNLYGKTVLASERI